MNSAHAHRARNLRLFQLVALGVLFLVGYGYFESTRFEDFLAYTVVLFAATAPVVVWIQFGAPGIPILPTSASLYWIYFGVPALRGVGEAQGYSPADVVNANLTVALFLGVATIAWAGFLRRPKITAGNETMDNRAVLYLVMLGLGLGVIFYIAVYANLAAVAGTAFGILRAVTAGPMLLACYLLGYGKAKKAFTDVQWLIALLLLSVTVILQTGSLLLIGGITEIAALAAGYVYTAKRVPWITALAAMAIVSILQAGKSDMRDRYANTTVTIQIMPQLFTEWFQIGINDLTSDTVQASSVAERASLLNQMIRVQQWTPERVPYLNGETYTYMPAMLVPRLINPSRSPTQIVMNLLDVRYGFLSVEQTKVTAVGVNVVPEAFANFGYLGIVFIGLIFGVFTGYFTALSISRSATALPTLLAIATTIIVTDLEADLSYLASVLFQTFIGIAAFYFGVTFVFNPHGKRPVKEGGVYLKGPY
jgi:hypothetical protein